MTPLQQFLVEAKSAGIHCADPAFRRAGAGSARIVGELTVPKPAMLLMLQAIAAMLESLPALDDPDAIQKTGSSICYLVDALRAEAPKPAAASSRVLRTAVADDAEGQPRYYWQDRDTA